VNILYLDSVSKEQETLYVNLLDVKKLTELLNEGGVVYEH
jgi:hypothetical protein